MFTLSLNYKSADVLLREKFCFDEKKAETLLYILKENNIKECVYLSTCNRCELYGVGDMYRALKIFSDFAGVEYEKVKSSILFYENNDAIRHLFRVCCGFDSMALGEDEILGQVKRAFEFSQQNEASGFDINTIFKAAITSAKRIKTDTLISKSSVSVATLVAARCHKFYGESKNVLIVGGSGEIGSKVIKNLVSYNEFNIYAAARNSHLPCKDINIIHYNERYNYIDAADIIICATKSPHFIFTADRVKNSIHSDKPRLFIDLAVPRDIDDEIGLLGVKGQKKLLNAKVLIIGAGGLGAPAAMYLAAAGVGTIGIADADEVDLSNLQRQVIHTTDDLGKPKVESAKETMQAINPDVKVITYHDFIASDNIMDIIKDYDFILDGTDNFPAKFLINDACVMAKKPFSHAGIIRFQGQLMTYVPDEGPCYRCVFKNPPPKDAVPTCKQAGVIGAMAGVIGCLQAMEAVKYITGAGDLLTGYLLTYDALKMEFRKIKLPKDDNCGVCSENPAITELIDYEQTECTGV